jgi:hypothetical protein
MQPFSSETKLPREPKLSYALKFELSCVMRCEFLFVSLLACTECNTVESDKVAEFRLSAFVPTCSRRGR